MFFFLQEKNNADRNSFYTPQIISEMLTQAVCDELDDSGVPFSRSTALGTTSRYDHQVRSPNMIQILISTSVDSAAKSYSAVSCFPRRLSPYGQILADSCGDFGKSVAFDHEGRKAKLLSGGSKPTGDDTLLIVIKPFNIHSPHLLDYLRHSKMLSTCIAQSLGEIYKILG